MSDDNSQVTQPADETVSLEDIFNAIERLQSEGLEWTASAIKAASGYDVLPVVSLGFWGGDRLQTVFTLANPVTKEAAQIFFFQSGEGRHKEIGETGRADLEKLTLGVTDATTKITARMTLKEYLDAPKSNPQP